METGANNDLISSAGKMKTLFGIVVLAAGRSSRLGQPKQLLHYNGQTLLRSTCVIALEANPATVVVVLGAYADEIKKELEDLPLQVTENKAWQEGMASSIRCGLATLASCCPTAEGVILLVCDQPFLNVRLLTELVETHHKTGTPIVASHYQKTFGPPVYFHKKLFPELLQLTGDVGARNIIRKHAEETAIVSFPEGTIDIDTEEEYKKLLQGGLQ